MTAPQPCPAAADPTDPLESTGATQLSRASRRGLLRRFRRDKKGVTAVEFGLVAMPFFLLLTAIIDTAMVSWADATLSHGVERASRAIRTGQAHSTPGGYSEANFKDAIRTEIGFLFSDEGSLHVEVKTYDNFVDIDLTEPVEMNDEGEITQDFDFDIGGPTEIVVARAYYTWKTFLPAEYDGKRLNFNTKGGRRLMVGTVAFRNEPFPLP